MSVESTKQLSKEEIKKILEAARNFVKNNGTKTEVQVMNSNIKADDQPKSYVVKS